MRSQVALSALIVFGSVLVVLGLVKFPYTVSQMETLVVETSREVPVTQSHSFTSYLTFNRTVTQQTSTLRPETRTTDTTSIIQIPKQATVYESNLTALSQAEPLRLGPFDTNPNQTIEVTWESNSSVLVYLLNETEASAVFGTLPTVWRNYGSGSMGTLSHKSETVDRNYVFLYANTSDTVIRLIRVILTWVDVQTITETRTFTTVLTEPIAVTTVEPLVEEHVYTTTFMSSSTSFYATSVETLVTETRFSDISFTAFMGSFLIFVGILLMLLLVSQRRKL